MADNRDDFIIALRYALLKKGAKQKFSLFFLISFSVLIIFLDKISLPITTFTRSVLNDIVYQISFAASTPGKVFNYLNDERSEHFNIVDKKYYLEHSSFGTPRWITIYIMLIILLLRIGYIKNKKKYISKLEKKI